MYSLNYIVTVQSCGLAAVEKMLLCVFTELILQAQQLVTHTQTHTHTHRNTPLFSCPRCRLMLLSLYGRPPPHSPLSSRTVSLSLSLSLSGSLHSLTLSFL